MPPYPARPSHHRWDDTPSYIATHPYAGVNPGVQSQRDNRQPGWRGEPRPTDGHGKPRLDCAPSCRKIRIPCGQRPNRVHVIRQHHPRIDVKWPLCLGDPHRFAQSNALVLLFSDLDGIDAETEKLILALSRANDLIVFNVSDFMVDGLPEGLKLTVTDGGLQAELDTDTGAPRQRIEAFLKGRVAMAEEWSRKYGFPLLPLSTSEPALDQIMRLLGHRGSAR